MLKDLVVQWRDDIVGEWRSELAGVDLLVLEPSAGRFTMTLSLRADGTAGWGFTIPDAPPSPPEPTPPFPEKWELSDDRVLSIWVPVAPMPEIDMPDWSREQMCFDVLAVTDLSLTLSRRRFDGEDVIVLRRVNREEYLRRQVAAMGRLTAGN